MRVVRDTSLRDEDGGVLVMVTVWLPVIVLFVIFVVDVGNWFEHKRHLQMQADAAALAGGGSFKFPCNDDSILASTRDYGGPHATYPTAAYNEQVGGTDVNNMHLLVNSEAYWNDGGTDFSDGGGPCEARMVDVKITESNLPWFFGVDVVPAINAHARVEIQGLSTSEGALPVGVPDVNPKAARAYFVDESTGAVIASTPLVQNGTTGTGLSLWENTEPLTVPISAAGSPAACSPAQPAGTACIGVRIALSGATSTTCGDPLVECYDLASANGGIVYLRGWTDGPGVPEARDVDLLGCSDPYFTMATCSAGISADIDFGSMNVGAASVWAQVNGANTKYPLANGGSGNWFRTSGLPVSQVGGNTVTLSWEVTAGTWTRNDGSTVSCNSQGNNPCKGTFGVVQRAFVGAASRSGPVEFAQVWEGGAMDANTFQVGTSPALTVKIGVKGSLKNAADVNDPPVYLRVAGNVNGSGNQSQNQSLDCDPDVSNLSTELAQGCAPAYTENTGTAACPASPSTLWGTLQPWQCVAVQTGQATNQVAQGLNLRILGSEKPSACTSPNNWALFGTDEGLPQGDPRVLQVFLTPFGSFAGSGSTTVPVTGFASFYVTGWTAQGGGFANPCQGNGDDPVPDNDAGVIVGHFIKYIFVLNEGGGSGELCDFNAFESCVAVLTE